MAPKVNQNAYNLQTLNAQNRRFCTIKKGEKTKPLCNIHTIFLYILSSTEQQDNIAGHYTDSNRTIPAASDLASLRSSSSPAPSHAG